MSKFILIKKSVSKVVVQNVMNILMKLSFRLNVKTITKRCLKHFVCLNVQTDILTMELNVKKDMEFSREVCLSSTTWIYLNLID